MNRPIRTFVSLSSVFCLIGANLASAQEPAAGPPDRESVFGLAVTDPLSVYVGDFKEYMTSPARWTNPGSGASPGSAKPRSLA